jgi:glycosyltransferase involved in cell wall biosynthesis
MTHSADNLRAWVSGRFPALKPSRFPRLYLISSELPVQQYAALLASMDAFVLPTRGEGFGLPIVSRVFFLSLSLSRLSDDHPLSAYHVAKWVRLAGGSHESAAACSGH